MVAPWDRRSGRDQRRVVRLLLAEWLPTAAFSPYWAGRLEQAGLAASSARSAEDLLRLEPVVETDVAVAGGAGAAGLVLRPTEDQVKAAASGGRLWELAVAIRRGGAEAIRDVLLREYKPIHLHRAGRDGLLLVAYSRQDLDRLHRTGARAARVLGLTAADSIVSALAPGPHLLHWGPYHLALGASILAVQPRASGHGLDVAVDGFFLVPATAVVVAPTEAELLAELAAKAGADLQHVRTVVTVGPPLPPDRRRAAADAWRAAGAADDVRIRALWGPAEGRAMWAECAEAGAEGGLHTYPDLEVIEVIDPTTLAVTTGPGDLTYTSAGWNGTALLRYRTGDYVAGLVTDEPCPGCGRTVPRIVGEVEPGPWQPLVHADDGQARVDLRGVPTVLAGIAEVGAWRVELRRVPGGGDEVFVEVAGRIDDVHGLAERLAAAVGLRPRVRVQADPGPVVHRTEELGTVFADLR